MCTKERLGWSASNREPFHSGPCCGRSEILDCVNTFKRFVQFLLNIDEITACFGSSKSRTHCSKLAGIVPISQSRKKVEVELSELPALNSHNFSSLGPQISLLILGYAA